MSDINKLWLIFKNSSMNDKDLQKAFERAVTPDACIELLEDIDTMQARITELETALTNIKKHQETVIVGMPQLSSVWQIASRALEK